MSLPETSEREGRNGTQWRVKEKLFVWERPLLKPDLVALGDKAPEGPILGVRVADLDDKKSLLGEDPLIFFTTPHFEGYPAILVQLERVPLPTLRSVIAEAWLTRAPPRLAKAHFDRVQKMVASQ
jgi:hypothetical protein